ncbi:unnamed protein product [Prorocentrum cordatum]|uniref:TFIIS central domain-containing protein n=1 Tax=Prorocentrum cordatum TaxID=2364126 RepID=A0ABN9V0C9_9DINO|nr:unnamed protein product [Polarella glacialis]
MDPAVRAVVGAGLGTAISTPAAAASARRALGGQQGERLWAMLRRWAIARAAPAAPAGGADRPARSAPKKAAAASVAAAEPLTEDVRQKVVGALMRTCASSAGRASIGTCRGIEQELFARLGSTPKEYRLRARSLLFNLRATDGILLGKVLAGSLPPSELVCLGTEELANDALKAQRKVERERYFRSEVHLAHGLPPPRRRRSSLQLRPGDAAEHAADEPGADAAAQGEPRRLRRRRSLAEPGAGPGAAPGAEGARSAKRRRSSTGPRVGDGGALLAPADAARATGASAQAGGAVLALADAATGPSVGNGGGISDGSSGSDSDSGSLSDSLSDSPSGGSSGSSSGSSESASSGGSEESAESDDSKENQAGAVQQLPGGGCRQVVLPLLERA